MARRPGGAGAWGGRATHHFLKFETQGSYSNVEGTPESRHTATTESGPPFSTSYPCGNRQYNRRGLCEQEGALSSFTISVPTGLVTVVRSCMGDSPSLISSVKCEKDAASREFIAHHFYVPEIDLFASRLNRLLPLYVSRLPDTSASAVDLASARGSSTHEWRYCLEFFRK